MDDDYNQEVDQEERDDDEQTIENQSKMLQSNEQSSMSKGKDYLRSDKNQTFQTTAGYAVQKDKREIYTSEKKEQ